MVDTKEAVRHTFKNRYGDTMSIVEIDKSTLLWRGSHNYERISCNEAGTITMVDPAGGPYICEGQDIGLDYPPWKGRIVDHFQHHEEGYLILCR